MFPSTTAVISARMNTGIDIIDVDDPHHDEVDGAAEVAGEEADQAAGDGREQRDHEGELKVEADRVEHADEDVAAELVGPERVRRRGCAQDPVGGRGRARAVDQGAEVGEQDERGEQAETPAEAVLAR